MNITYKELRENKVNGNIITDLYYDGDLQCGTEFKFNYDLETFELVDSFSIENGQLMLNDDKLFQELTCNRTFIERAFNALNIGG